ncbi:hypothetical protein CF328_g7629, partial [Tilletia controversa]
FYVDLFLAFGLGPACGVYGLFADAFADTVRAEGLATTAHWVDDNVFIRVLQRDLPRVNIRRKLLHKTITGGPQSRGGSLFWTSTDGVEHTEDYAQPLKSQPGAEDGYNCSLADIDRISAQLGWPWEPEKDSPWSTIFKYAGIVYNIATREVALPESKREKYLATIAETREQAAAQGGRHQLPVIERLHGQCQWARNVYTEGKWHLAGLQAFIKTASQDRKLRHQWRHGGKKLADDIDWWESTLRCQDNTWRSFDPATPVDIDCYCDGSTSFGVGLSIQGRERAYPLRDDAVGNTDIKIVEALALELAVLTAIDLGYIAYDDALSLPSRQRTTTRHLFSAAAYDDAHSHLGGSVRRRLTDRNPHPPSVRCTTTPGLSPTAYDDAPALAQAAAYDDAVAPAAARRGTDPLRKRTEMESPSSIQMASAGDTASAETTRRGWPQYDTQAPHVRADRCPPTRSMTSAAHDHRHLIDLATDYPFGGFQPARADSAVRAHLPPSRSPLFASPPQNDAIFARALDFLAGAGFQLTDPALVPLLQDAAATIAAARCLSRALVAQSEATHADSPLPAHESAAHPSRQQNTSARTPSLQSKHRLPKGMVGDSPFDRLPVSSNHGAQQAHTQRDLRLESPASPSSAQSLQASRPVAPSGTWTPTDGGWHPRIVASVRYSGGPSFDDFEAFVFDMRRVFRTYPAHGIEIRDPSGRAPERGHAVQTKVLKTSKTWRHLLEDWKEKSIKTRTPQTRPGSQELTHVSRPRDPTPAPTPTPETSAPKPTTSFASGSGLPFVPPKPKKRNGPNRPGSNRIPIVPTVDRPEEVDGPERFTQWKPPRHLRPPTNRSDREEEAVRQAIIASFAPGTKKGYGTAMAHWHRFCDEHEVAEERRCPADPELVELWIAKQAGVKSGGYLSDWVSGLKAWHHLNNVPWLAEEERLRLVKRGARYEQPPPRP